MNYYERHLGDYARDTGHLSMLEHGAYTLLMDRYYVSEAGIPADQAHRYAHAKSKDEKEATDNVLKEFFVLLDGTWIKNRIEQEIEKAQSKIKAAQANGKLGGRPKLNPNEPGNKPSGFSVGFENESQPKAHQPPNTKHQSPDINNPPFVEDLLKVVPTPVGAVCCAIKATYDIANKQILDINQENPTLKALIEAGATVNEFTSAAIQASRANKGFNYLLAIVKRERQDAMNLNVHKGPMPMTNREAGRSIAAQSIFTPANTRHLQGPILTLVETENEVKSIAN